MNIPPEYINLVKDVSEMTQRINEMRKFFEKTPLLIEVPLYKKLAARMDEINKHWKLFFKLNEIKQKIKDITTVVGKTYKGKYYIYVFNQLIDKNLIEGEILGDSPYNENNKKAEDSINNELNSLNSQKNEIETEMKRLKEVNKGQTSMTWSDLSFSTFSRLSDLENFLSKLMYYEREFMYLSSGIESYNQDLSKKIYNDIWKKFDKVFINLNKVPSMKFFDGTFNYDKQKEYITYLKKYNEELSKLISKYKKDNTDENKKNQIESKIDTFKIWTNRIPQKDNIIECLGKEYNHCISRSDFYECINVNEDPENKKKNCIYKAAREAAGIEVENSPDNILLDALDSDCAICMEPLKDGDELCMPFDCNHLFHCKCIDKWLSENYTCPLCRKKKYGSSSSFGRWYTSSSVPLGVDIKVGDIVKVGKDKNLKKSVPPSVRLKKGHRKVVCEFGSGGKIKKGSMFMVDGVSNDGSFVRAKIV